MSYNRRLERVITNIIRGNKADLDKINGSIVRMENKLLLTCKYGTLTLNNINGCYELCDNGNVNSWNSDMIDHISSFSTSISPVIPLLSHHVKDRIIIFSSEPQDTYQHYKTFTYTSINCNRLDELYNKGYRYYITTEENHTNADIMQWINNHRDTRFLHLKQLENAVIPPNSVSFDHRWIMFSILEQLFPNQCHIIRSANDPIPTDKRVILCIMNDDEWSKLQYSNTKYYWSVNCTKYHHNSIRYHTGNVSLLEDALWIMDYYITNHHKPESSLIGKYKVINGIRVPNLFDKYVMHNGEEINTYIIDV